VVRLDFLLRGGEAMSDFEILSIMISIIAIILILIKDAKK